MNRGATLTKLLLSSLGVLLIIVVEVWSRQPPERFFVARTVVLDTTKAVPEQGIAFRISVSQFGPSLASDKESVSQLILFENGQELQGRSVHADIRSRPGRYSHWGDAILFSTQDGTDPRVNGYRYQLRLPPAAPNWHQQARSVLLGAAALILLLSLHLATGGSIRRTAYWAVGGLAGLAVLALSGVYFSSPARELDKVAAALRKPDGESGVAKRSRVSEVAPTPRTRHLLRGQIDHTFVPLSDPIPHDEARLISLQAESVVPRSDGFVELTHEAKLINRDPLDIRSADLESIVIELDVKRGSRLALHLSNRATGSQSEIGFEISASPETQTFRFARPAHGKLANIRYVRLQANQGDGDVPLVRVRSVQYRLRLDAFTEQPSGFSSVDLQASLRPGLWQSVPGRFVLPLKESDGSLLKLAVGALTESAPRAPGGTHREPISFSVSVINEDGGSSLLHRGSLEQANSWHELSIDLRTNKARQLVLEGLALERRSALVWSGVRLIDRQRLPERVVLILADTLRSDALGCYGRSGNPTPALDALSRQGVRFERAFSQSYWTRPSMASLLTGHYVGATGVAHSSQRLANSFETLAERFADGGFLSVGIVTNTNAGGHAGLDQGFDRQLIVEPDQDRADKLIRDLVLPVLDELSEDDLFFYLHLMDPHGPYGPAELPADFELPKSGVPVPFESHLDRPWNQRPTVENRRVLYDYDVRVMDRALGEFFDELDRRWERPPLITFTSDHGELLGERDLWGHGFASLYPENVQVPLIIRSPDRIDQGLEFDGPVEVRYLGGTLLDLVGLRREEGTAETWPSLLPLLENPSMSSPTFAISATEESDRSVFSLFGQQFGYVSRSHQGTSDTKVFSDSAFSDRVSFYWLHPLFESYFSSFHQSYVERQQAISRRKNSQRVVREQVIDRQALENLRALGYLDE